MPVEPLIIRAGKKPIAPGGLCGWTAPVSTRNHILWGLSTVRGSYRPERRVLPSHACYQESRATPLPLGLLLEDSVPGTVRMMNPRVMRKQGGDLIGHA